MYPGPPGPLYAYGDKRTSWGGKLHQLSWDGFRIPVWTFDSRIYCRENGLCDDVEINADSVVLCGHGDGSVS